MYKNLFRAILGVIGIFGILSLGIADATDVTITYNLSGGYRVEDGTTGAKEVPFTTDANGMVGTTNRKTPSKSGNTCNGMKCMFDGWYLENGARWTGYADSGMTVYAKWLPFKDLTITTGDFIFIIMDRNLGATVKGTGCNDSATSTCGYHFQWGNNYGFKPYRNNATNFPNGEDRNPDPATDREGHISTYYNGIYKTAGPWNSVAQAKDNLWGGSETSNPDEDKQGPCPDGYHVPDTLEWKAIGTLLNAGNNGYSIRDILNLPFAGCRIYSHNKNVRDMGSYAYYWSSTPSSKSDAYYLYFSSSSINRQNNYPRSDALPIRCFKNSSAKTLTFSVEDEVLATKNLKWWEPVTKSYAPEVPNRENKKFAGWFADGSDDAFVFGTDVYLSQDTTLNAKYECDIGYVENKNGTGCEKIRAEFDANGGNFWDENVKIIEPNIVGISNPIKYSHTSNIDDEGNKISDYENLLNINEVVTITGATNLHVKINCGFRGRSYSSMAGFYGSILMWAGNHPNYTTKNYLSTPIANLPTLGESCRYEYDIEGDTVTFACSTESDSAGTWGDRYGYYAIIEGTGFYVTYPDNAFDNIPEPTREGHKFKGWYLSGGAEFDSGSVSTGEVIYVHAKWECAQGYVDKQGQCVKEETKPSGGSSGGGGGGGGGSSSSSCKNLPANAVANNSSTPSSNTNYYYSTNTSKVCTFQCKSGYTRNEEKETCDKISDTQTTSGTNVKEPEANTGNNTKVETGNNTEIQTGSKIDAPEQTPQDDKQDTQDSITKTPEGKTNSTTSSTYSPEFQEAYEFAHENGITTKNTIQSADMNGKLTRIAMAKMLSQYAINVLGKTPDATLNNKFNDVTDKRDADYDNGVTLAYQLGIMGQNMPNNKFRPDDEVTRAEFATALSRMLYKTSDGQYKSTDKYYTNHMSKLVKEGIITKDDPKMKELRGYVMIMLMRSAK